MIELFIGEYERLNDTVTYFRWFMRLLFTTFVVCAVIIIEQMQYSAYRINQQDKINAASMQLQAASARFETLITSEILRASSLSNYIVISGDDSRGHWETLSFAMLRDSRILDSVVIAPSDTVSMVIPSDHNQQLLGVSFPFSSRHWPGVLTAKVNQAPVVNGPIQSQAGVAKLLLRLPVFLDPPNNEHYWGGLTLELDWFALLEQAGILGLLDHYDVAIYSDDYNLASEDPAFGQHIHAPHASHNIYLPLNHWRIESRGINQNIGGEIWNSYAKIRLFGYPILVLLSIAFIVIYRLYRTANQQSMQDELTQLPNRRYLMYTLKQLAEHATRSNSVFTVLNIDLNKFKMINDTLGHSAGDDVLQEVANRLKSGLRGTDVVARVGGDEFIALIPRVGLQFDIEIIIGNLKTRIESTPIELKMSQKELSKIDVTCSFGYAIFSKDSSDIDALLRKADERMYQVKKGQL